MNIAELKAWVSAKFWNSEQVAAWVRNNFVQRSQVRLDNYTLTVTGNSTVNGSLVGNMTGSGTVATGGFTLTIPATGTAVLLGTAQTITGVKTFSNGLVASNVTTGNITLSYVEVANDNIGGLSVWTSSTNCVILVHNLSYATVAMFLIRAGLNTVVEIGLDSTSQFSHTKDTASSVNVYYDATFGYVIQNKMGAGAFIGVLAIHA